jgi:hypothetical protein
MQDKREQVWGEKNRQTTSRKMDKAQNKRLARRTTTEPSSATSRPPLGLLPELFKVLHFAFRFEFE